MHRLSRSPRKLAFDGLYRILRPSDEEHTGLRIGLDDWLHAAYQQENTPTQDKAFCTHLTYTLCRYWFALDPVLARLSSTPLKKLETRVLILLKLGLIQLSEFIECPDYAAINETMALAKQMRLAPRAQGFIHAILRQAAKHAPVQLAPDHVFPQWYQDRLRSEFGQQWLDDYTNAFLTPPEGVSIRLNPLKTSLEKFLGELDRAGIDYERPDSTLPEALYLPTLSRPHHIPGYTEGYFTPQDRSATRVSRLLDPQPSERILEIGAAPGGKTTHIATLMENTGHIVACDSSASRLQQLKDNAKRLGCKTIQPLALDMCSRDAIKTCDKLTEPFDRILIDGPCSATGVMRKHPDILLQLRESDAEERQTIQLELLLNAIPLLKPGGTLVYATCSVDPNENKAVIQAALKKSPKPITLVHETLSPLTTHQDGFYTALLVSD